mgnify:FL=1
MTTLPEVRVQVDLEPLAHPRGYLESGTPGSALDILASSANIVNNDYHHQTTKHAADKLGFWISYGQKRQVIIEKISDAESYPLKREN